MNQTDASATADSWQPPPQLNALAAGEVHVWRIGLDQPPMHRENLRCLLAADERARAERFYFRRDREHFIVARGALRATLASYMGVKPDALRFRYNSYGKPALAAEFDRNELCFNLSHSCGLALLAIARQRSLGVDVESYRDEPADEGLAARFFSARELATLLSLPSNIRTRAFFNCWTRKEAYIKARGEGLSIPLDQFDVSLAPHEPAALLWSRSDPHEAVRWSLRELNPGPGYVGALAVEGHDWQLKCWQWRVG